MFLSESTLVFNYLWRPYGAAADTFLLTSFIITPSTVCNLSLRAPKLFFIINAGRVLAPAARKEMEPESRLSPRCPLYMDSPVKNKHTNVLFCLFPRCDIHLTALALTGHEWSEISVPTHVHTLVLSWISHHWVQIRVALNPSYGLRSPTQR